MTATYTSTLPAVKDRIRFQLGDTDTASPLLSDEEIAAVLTLKSDNEADALLYLAKGLLRRHARLPVKFETDGQRFDYSARVEAWKELVAELERTATTTVTAGMRIRRMARPANITDQGEYST